MTAAGGRIVAAVTFADGFAVEPTPAGVRAVENLVRAGWSLADAVAHIAGAPAVFRGAR